MFLFNDYLNKNDDSDKHDSEWGIKRTTCFIIQQAMNLTLGNFIQDIANSLILTYKQAKPQLTSFKKEDYSCDNHTDKAGPELSLVPCWHQRMNGFNHEMGEMAQQM